MAAMKVATVWRLEQHLSITSTRGIALSCSVHRTPAFRRSIHTSPRKDQDVAIHGSLSATAAAVVTPPNTAPPAPSTSAMSGLPLSQVLRTFVITSVSSSPTLLDVMTKVLRRMLESKNPLFNIEKNPVMKALLWHTFYKQFCGGENAAQVNQMCEELRAQGYAGVILEYALEVLKDAEGNEAEDVAAWRKGILDSISVAGEGDYVGLKWSGLGSAALRLMAKEENPTKLMSAAMHEVCAAASARGVSLLPAAEETWNLPGFFKWSMQLQRVYNMNGRSVVYSTYQAYLKQMPQYLAEHLADAQKHGYTLGAKLVRGAYLATEKRELIWPTIEDTHSAYDKLASALIHREYNDLLQPLHETEKSAWPKTNVVLATHNLASVEQARAHRQAQADRGESLTPLTFAQLQGMADEVSCSLIAAARANGASPTTVQEKVLKCTTWGPMYECLNYLLRRAAENKDAASRTIDTRRASQAEMFRRLRAAFGLA